MEMLRKTGGKTVVIKDSQCSFLINPMKKELTVKSNDPVKMEPIKVQNWNSGRTNSWNDKACLTHFSETLQKSKLSQHNWLQYYQTKHSILSSDHFSTEVNNKVGFGISNNALNTKEHFKPFCGIADNKSKNNHANSASTEDKDLSYCVKNGYLFIINNVNFDNRFDGRNESHSDVLQLKKFFSDRGFLVNHLTDLSSQQTIDECKKLARDQDINDFDCFMMLISSHGNEKGIVCKDNETLPLNSILEIFTGVECRISVNKPKIFFVQACRGVIRDPGRKDVDLLARGGYVVERDAGSPPALLPSDSNILVAHSTTDGKPSHLYSYHPFSKHKPLVASWFLSCVLDIFSRYMETEDLLTMLTRVNRQMTYYGDEEGVKQISSQINRLTYKIYFSMT